jgi:4-hydroxybenzoate polyprenyltransferase
LTRILKKAFDFFVFSSLFIAFCAIFMVYQTDLLFDIPPSFKIIGFVFSGTVCSYNFHWYLTPPNVGGPTEKVVWNIRNKQLHLILFFIGLLGSIIFSFLLINHWFWLGVTAFVTFLYSAPKIAHPLFTPLRKVAVGKTIFLAFSWTHVTALLPMVIHNHVLSDAQIWFVVNRFFFIYAICILFDYRDRESDKKDQIRSLITMLNEKGIDILFWGSMAAYFISIVLLAPFFNLGLIGALTLPSLLLCFLYYPSKNTSSDYLYYFVLDGFMMLSAPLVVLVKFVR